MYDSPEYIVVRIFASLSCFGSLSIIVTCILFPSMLSKIFMRIITIIAICDCIGCVPLLFGFPSSSSVLCPLQATMTLFFLRASVFWTTCLTWQLYCLVLYNRLIASEYQMHLLCWIFSLICFFLPFSTNVHYGIDDEYSGDRFCELAGNRKEIGLWVGLTQLLPLLSCIAMMMYFYLQITRYYSQERLLTNERIKSVADVLKLYPLLLIICWTPNAIISTVSSFVRFGNDSIQERIIVFTLSIGSLNGFFLSMIYFVNSKEARERWVRLLTRGHHSDVMTTDFKDIESYEATWNNSRNDRHLTTQSVTSVSDVNRFTKSFISWTPSTREKRTSLVESLTGDENRSMSASYEEGLGIGLVNVSNS